MTITPTAVAASARETPGTSATPGPQPSSSSQSYPMRIDRVVGSMPELGPSTPEGGLRGWFCALAVAALGGVLPSLALALGAVVVRDTTFGTPVAALPPPGAEQWDGTPLWVPAFFSAAWSFTAPWARALTAAGRRAQSVGVVGAATAASAQLAAALLTQWPSAMAQGPFIVVAGLLAGAGCALAQAGGAAALRLHFRRRLARAHAVARALASLMLCAAPLAMYALLEIRDGEPWGAQLVQAAVAAGAGLLAAVALRSPPTPPPSTSHHQTASTSPLTFNVTLHNNGSGYELLKVDGVGRYDVDSDEELLPASPSESPRTSVQMPAPKPLFSEVDLEGGASGVDAVFVDDVPSDEEVVLYAIDARSPSMIRAREVVDSLKRPLFYAALLLLLAERLGDLAFWLLAPAAVWRRTVRLDDYQALLLTSRAALLGAFPPLLAPVLRSLGVGAITKALVASCTLGTLGCFGLGSGTADRSVVWMALSVLLLRMGLSCAQTLRRPLLLRAMGGAHLSHARAPLDMLTGGCVLLATLFVGPNYSGVFWWLAFLQLAATLAAPALYFASIRRMRH